MVGELGASRKAAAELSVALRAAYAGSADSWDGGPGQMYRGLARALAANSAVPVRGARVLDLGAGTGAAGAAALAAGAREVVAADLAAGMLAHCPPGLRPVVADVMTLPFRDRSFGLGLAAFALGHLPDTRACLDEVRRTCAALAASSFAAGWTHPAKSMVDATLAEFGYQPPAWYLTFKQHTEPRSQDPEFLRAQASAAGFTNVEVRTLLVRTPVVTPGQLVSWRLGLAHVAPFVAALAPARRSALRRAAEAAVSAAALPPLEVSMLVLTAR
jgi:ubiquinone/menaquinone biosynthesis C-methylase UbiE